MKKYMFLLMTMVAAAITPLNVHAIDNNTVEIVFSGTTASVTIADNISSYVTCSSATSSHVVLVQSSDFAGIDATTDNEDGEIIYSLSGLSTDGQLYLEGSYKCTVELDGLTLSNTSGPALCIVNGKRVAVKAQKGTTNTLADGASDSSKGCYYCKGHTKFKGKGTLNITGNYAHGVYSKEYVEVKNLTLNIVSAAKDAIHCKEYFLMESGTLTIGSATDDGIQVELDGTTSTGATADHDDEDSGSFYQEGGTLTIGSWGGKAIKADGTITNDGGKWSGFSASDNSENNASGITSITTDRDQGDTSIFDLNGRKVSKSMMMRGVYVVKNGKDTRKVYVK